MTENNYDGRMHIGDGVYVKYDGYHLVLTANNPITDTVYLDFYVRQALRRVLDQIDKTDEDN